MANIFTDNPYKTPTTAQSIPQYSYPTAPLNPASVASTKSVDQSQAPVIPANTSDVSAQTAAIQEQIKKIQSQVDAAQKAGYGANDEIQRDTQGNVVQKQPEKTAEPTIWDKIMGRQEQVQQQVQDSQQALLQQQNNIYAQWGLTPENYNKIQDLTVQIGEYQKQLADINTRESQAIDAAQNRPGQDIAFASGETARIQRAYAIQKAGVAANASVLASTAQALQGNWDNAFKSAQLYVDNATKAQQQVVSDLRWGFEQYSDIVSTMTAQEQDQLKAIISQQNDELDRQQTDYWKQIEVDQRQQGINIDYMKAAQSGGSGSGLPGGAYSKDQLSYINTVQDNARQDPDIKIFSDIRGAYEQAVSARNQKDSIGDIVLMRTVAKMTDPSSSVREEEFQTFQSAQGVLPKYGVQLTTGMVGKGQLTDAGRTAILNQIQSIYDQRKGAYDYKNNFYNEQLKRQGITEPAVPTYSAPSNVVTPPPSNEDQIINQVVEETSKPKKSHGGLPGGLWGWLTGTK